MEQIFESHELPDTLNGSRHYITIFCPNCKTKLAIPDNIYKINLGSVWVKDVVNGSVKMQKDARNKDKIFVHGSKTLAVARANPTKNVQPVEFCYVDCAKCGAPRVGARYYNVIEQEGNRLVELRYKIHKGFYYEGDKSRHELFTGVPKWDCTVEKYVLDKLIEEGILEESFINVVRLRDMEIYKMAHSPLPSNIDQNRPSIKRWLKDEKVRVDINYLFCKEMGFKVLKEDCSTAKFGLMLAVFDPITGIKVNYDSFIADLREEFKWVTDKYRKEADIFVQTAFQALSNTEAYQNFKDTPTLELIKQLEKKLKAESLIQKTRPLWSTIAKFSTDVPCFLMDYRELYLPENSQRVFVSCDLKSANFNTLRMLNSNLVLNCNTWDELAKRFSKKKLIAKSKQNRVRLLGKLKHTKIRVLESHILDLIFLAFKTRELPFPYKIWMFSCDELLIEVNMNNPKNLNNPNNNNIDTRQTWEIVKEILEESIKEHLPLLKDYIRVGAFCLQSIPYSEEMKQRVAKWEQTLLTTNQSNNNTPKEEKEEDDDDDNDPILIFDKKVRENLPKKPQDIYFVRKYLDDKKLDFKHVSMSVKFLASLNYFKNQHDFLNYDLIDKKYQDNN